MSDFPHQPSATPAPPLYPPPAAGAPDGGARPSAPGRSPRRWLLPVLVGAVALVVGAAGATAAFLLLDRRAESQSHYAVSVFLDHDATAAQRDTLEDALDELPGARDIEFQTREEAYTAFQEQFKDEPELLDDVRPETLPESFRFTKTDTTFECAHLKPVYDMPGVADIVVVKYPAKDDLGGPVKCF